MDCSDYRLRSFVFLLHISQTDDFPPYNTREIEEVKKVSGETCKIYRVCGNVYFWIDIKATKIYNKVFFVRVKETENNV